MAELDKPLSGANAANFLRPRKTDGPSSAAPRLEVSFFRTTLPHLLSGNGVVVLKAGDNALQNFTFKRATSIFRLKTAHGE